MTIINTETLEVKNAFRISTATNANTAIKSIEFARRGSAFLVNSQDRVIRVFDREIVLSCEAGTEPEPIQKLQDLVNRTLWKKCCFSGDGEFIVAGSSRQHALYIWERSVGNLVKMLSGTKGELLLDVVWHPIRPIICSVAGSLVSIWSQTHVENWSAFAPDFKELDENVEYDERESEFDLEDEDKEEEVTEGNEILEDEDVDVVTAEKPIYYSSDEDEEVCLYYLPVAPEIDEPEGEVHGIEPASSLGHIDPNQENIAPDARNGLEASSSNHTAADSRANDERPASKKPRVIDVQINGDIYNHIGSATERQGNERAKSKKDSAKTSNKRSGARKSQGNKGRRNDFDDTSQDNVDTSNSSATASTVPFALFEDSRLEASGDDSNACTDDVSAAVAGQPL